jgi:hypothetical protein
MRASFGRWQDGYISLNGAWCEPITADLIQSINHKLVETKRALRQQDKLGQHPCNSNAVDAGNEGRKVGEGVLEEPAE